MPFFVIDRIEGSIAVVVADDGRTFDVPTRALPNVSREGTVLRIDRAADSKPPDWAEAIADEAERLRRLDRARQTIHRLSRTDDGGDIEL
jgi:Protein of unknown function (DUF3006)